MSWCSDRPACIYDGDDVPGCLGHEKNSKVPVAVVSKLDTQEVERKKHDRSFWLIFSQTIPDDLNENQTADLIVSTEQPMAHQDAVDKLTEKTKGTEYVLRLSQPNSTFDTRTTSVFFYAVGIRTFLIHLCRILPAKIVALLDMSMSLTRNFQIMVLLVFAWSWYRQCICLKRVIPSPIMSSFKWQGRRSFIQKTI